MFFRYTSVRAADDIDLLDMYASFNKLWKLLIDRNMKQKDLMAVSGISQATIGKLRRCETVNSEILIRICAAMNCDIGDIMEVKLDVSNSTHNSIK